MQTAALAEPEVFFDDIPPEAVAATEKTNSSKAASEVALAPRRLSPRALILLAIAGTVIIGVAVAVGVVYGLKARRAPNNSPTTLESTVTRTALSR